MQVSDWRRAPGSHSIAASRFILPGAHVRLLSQMLKPAVGNGEVSPADLRRGVLLMLATTFMFVSLDAVAKHLTQSYPVVQVVWGRYFFHALALAVLLRQRLPVHLASARPVLQLVRSALLLVTTVLFFLGLRTLKLVDASSIMFAGPLLVTALSMPLLGERVGPRRWAAVLVGFCGALVIVRPGTGMMQASAIYPLLAVVCYAFYQIITRQLSRHDSSITTIIYTAAVGGLVTTAALPWNWVTPGVVDWLLMALIGVLGAAGHFSLIRALSAAPAALVAPFGYSSLIWSTSLGFLVFAETPDAWTLVGAGIIITSGLYVLRREQTLRETRQQEPTG